MFSKSFQALIVVLFVFFLTLPAEAQKACFTREARAELSGPPKFIDSLNPDMTQCLVITPAGVRGWALPAVDSDGRAKPINCVANKKLVEGAGRTPKFYCSAPGAVDEHGEPIRYKVKPHFKGQSPDRGMARCMVSFCLQDFPKRLVSSPTTSGSPM